MLVKEDLIAYVCVDYVHVADQSDKARRVRLIGNCQEEECASVKTACTQDDEIFVGRVLRQPGAISCGPHLDTDVN